MRFDYVVLLVCSAGIQFAAEPFTGTWRLDPAKSSGTIPKDETVTIRQRGELLEVEVGIVGGGPDQRTFVIKYAAPIKGGMGRIEQGPYDGVSLRRINSRTIETTYLTDGKDARSTRAAVSKDGRFMTSTGSTSGPGYAAWTMVFERQKPAR